MLETEGNNENLNRNGRPRQIIDGEAIQFERRLRAVEECLLTGHQDSRMIGISLDIPWNTATRRSRKLWKLAAVCTILCDLMTQGYGDVAMIHAQLVSRHGESLQALIRSAIANGRIRSLQVSRVAGGLKITHKKHPGTITLQKTRGPLVAAISCTNPRSEWRLLETFVGRLAYHFPNETSSINIQLVAEE